MDIACFLFDGITALDIVGPVRGAATPARRGRQVRRQAGGRVRTDNKFLALVADYAIDEVTSADILVVPGGFATRALEHDEETLDWIRAIDADDDVDDVGVHRLDAARGGRAARGQGGDDALGVARHGCAEYGAIPTGRRVVEQGKIITAAGVSSGIDMALTLAARIAGDEFAQAIQLGIEYDPQPPFDAGSVDKAPDQIVELLANMYAGRVCDRGDNRSIECYVPRDVPSERYGRRTMRRSVFAFVLLLTGPRPCCLQTPPLAGTVRSNAPVPWCVGRPPSEGGLRRIDKRD